MEESQNITDTKLGAIEALIEQGSAGTWMVRNGAPSSVWRSGADTWLDRPVARNLSDEDAWLIAETHNALPGLIGDLRAARAEIARLQAELDASAV